jgi:hypothetical protein
MRPLIFNALLSEDFFLAVNAVIGKPLILQKCYKPHINVKGLYGWLKVP